MRACVCVCVRAHVYEVYEDTHVYNDMCMTQVLSRMYGGIQERGDVELRSNTLIYKHRTEIAGDRYTLREMTLILDQRHWEH